MSRGGLLWGEPASSGLDLPLRSIVVSIAIDPTSPRTLYAAAGTAGAYKSSDGGDAWTPINAGLPPDAYVGVLAIDPTTAATLYVGTSGNGVFMSIDAGASWVAVNGGLTDSYTARSPLIRRSRRRC